MTIGGQSVLGKHIWSRIKAALNPDQPPAVSDVVSPVSSLSIADAESALGCAFPDEVRVIYESTNGLGAEMDTPYAPGLLSLEEVVSLHTQDERGYIPAWWRRFGLIAFWTDHNSNYMAVRVEEPLVGHVAFIDHEEGSPASRYRSVDSFLKQAEVADETKTFWFDWSTDFPLPEAITEKESEARDYFWRQMQSASDDDAIMWFRVGAHLVSKAEVECLVPFLDSENMWIQEIATQLISQSESADAMMHLKRMAREGMHNAQTTAMYAIGRIAGADAISILEDLAQQAEHDKAKYIRQVIEQFRRKDGRNR